MKHLITLLILSSLFSCQKSKKESLLEEKVPAKIIAFGSKELQKYDEQDPGGYAYDITVFDITNPAKVEGYFHYYPYGTDSSVGSFTGSYDSTNSIIQGKISAYAEGEKFEDYGIWKIANDELITGYARDNGKPDSINLEQVDWSYDYPSLIVDYDSSKKWLTDLQNEWHYFDGFPLDSLQLLLDAPTSLDSSNVLSKHVDLDGNYETEESFFYLKNEKRLIVLNKENEIQLDLKQVGTPLYMDSYLENNKWKALAFKTFEGFTLLKPNKGFYDQSVSVPQREVEWHPENYYRVF